LLYNGALGELQADQQKAVAVMTSRLKMLTELVNDLIVIPMVEERALRQEPVDLSSLVQSLVDDFQLAAHQAEVKLETQIAPDLPLVSGDPARLWQVIENLLNNALKFTPAGGSVTVRIDQAGPKVALEVNDTGIGISPEHLERVFERFYQVDGSSTRRYGGTGLGLALVKEVVEAHSGQVTVESKVGEGSTFRIMLPKLEGA
jgi:two-component system phosphate regulon sensor histidine kinase PhoR